MFPSKTWNLKKKSLFPASEWCRATMSPRKITSRASRFAEWPPSQSKSTPVVPYALSQNLHNSYSTSSILISNKKHLAFTSTKSLFLKKSQNDQNFFQRRPSLPCITIYFNYVH